MLLEMSNRILCQIKLPKRVTAGGIILTQDASETDQWNTQVAMVRAIGPLAFKDPKTLEEWPEGAWAGPGDFVRVPKFGGDKWTVKLPAKSAAEETQEVLFVIFSHLDLVGKISGDPLAMKAFV
jgi:co-chaperonin GroES (HSP10)